MRINTSEAHLLITPLAPQTQQRHDCVAVDATELARLDGYAQFVLGALKEQLGADAGYDEKSLSAVSRNVGNKRMGYDSATAEKIATLYGAFLGRMLIAAFPDAAPAWVRADNKLAIAFQTGTVEPLLFFPVASVCKHIEMGEKYSLHRCFTELRATLAAAAAAPPPAMPDSVQPDAPQSGGSTVRPATDHEASPGAMPALHLPPIKHPAMSADIEADLGPDDNGAPIILHLPQMCCNCSSHTYPAARDTVLHYEGVPQMTIKFSYCGDCAPVGGQAHPKARWRGRIIVVMSAAVAFAAYQFGDVSAIASTGMFALGLAFAFWMRSPATPASQLQRPVSLVGLQRGPRGIKQLALRFSNEQFAREFSTLNARLHNSGILRIALAPKVRSSEK